MNWEVADVRLDGEYVLWVRFNDGLEGLVKFMPSAFRGVFARLGQRGEFAKVSVVDGVVTWPEELDLAPDTMHQQISRYGEWIIT